MSKISCDIIQDMLPLYYDEVCSADSRKMIEEHLQECEKCSNIFQKLKTECVVDTKENAESIQSSVMGKMAHSWKRSLLRSFIIGIVITTIVLTAIFGTYAYAKTRMKAADYKLVYSGQMERWDEPEDIYIAHNQSNRPNAQKMRSVSISDIIVIHNRSETQAFYVDEYGYRQVNYLLPELENLKQSEPEPYER